MHILQRMYKNEGIGEQNNSVVIILPHASMQISRFEQIVMQSIKEVSRNEKITCTVLSGKDEERTPDANYNAIYNAEKVIIEATDGKANIFYMMGLAHALGKQVCVCYMEKSDSAPEIPFNVHTRQSVQYSLSTVANQNKLKEKLTEWLKEVKR